MKVVHNLPLNWELLQPILDRYATDNNMVLQFSKHGEKIAIKMLREGVPLRLDFFQTRTGVTLNAELGKDRTANFALVEYIENEIGYKRLKEDRVTFRNISNDVQSKVKQRIINYGQQFDLLVTQHENSSKFKVKDNLINNEIRIEFYPTGTIYLFGYNTPLFDEIYNLIYSQTGVFPKTQFLLLNQVVNFAKESLMKDDFSDCKVCKHHNRCLSNAAKMLNIAHFDRSITVYPCQRVINNYVCRYMHRYSSEVSNLISLHSDYLDSLKDIHVLSLGCGASPDLLALKYLFDNKAINYTGIDYNKEWQKYHDFFQDSESERSNIKYYYLDFFEVIDRLNKENKNLRFNVVVMNYVVSTISINHNIEEIFELFSKIKSRILDYLPVNSLFIINDINNKDHFVEIMDNVFKKEKFIDFDIQTYFHNGKNLRYLSSGNAIDNAAIKFYIGDDLIDSFNSQLECNSAAFILRKTS
jgi:hypothetical protein